MRIGIDLGGTKTEIISLDKQSGEEIYRKRVSTHSENYTTLIASLTDLVKEAEAETGKTSTVGMGIPGAISLHTGKVKNSNLQIINGEALAEDMAKSTGREVRCSNDANCLAVSEATDGAAAGHEVVFAGILGTGCGAGIALNGKVWDGPNRVAGEWGHNPLPWITDDDELLDLKCWCGLKGCQELYISGTGFEKDYAFHEKKDLPGSDIIAAMRTGDAAAKACFDRYIDRLTRALAGVINLLDPDVIVLGGGMSNVDELYDRVPKGLSKFIFGGEEACTLILKNKHGDSSGVRGAAWLFQAS